MSVPVRAFERNPGSKENGPFEPSGGLGAMSSPRARGRDDSSLRAYLEVLAANAPAASFLELRHRVGEQALAASFFEVANLDALAHEIRDRSRTDRRLRRLRAAYTALRHEGRPWIFVGPLGRVRRRDGCTRRAGVQPTAEHRRRIRLRSEPPCLLAAERGFARPAGRGGEPPARGGVGCGSAVLRRRQDPAAARHVEPQAPPSNAGGADAIRAGTAVRLDEVLARTPPLRRATSSSAGSHARHGGWAPTRCSPSRRGATSRDSREVARDGTTRCRVLSTKTSARVSTSTRPLNAAGAATRAAAAARSTTLPRRSGTCVLAEPTSRSSASACSGSSTSAGT